MNNKHRDFIIFLIIYGIFLIISCWNLPITESTEGRYAEIAREMLRSWNFLEPTFQGIYHFHKPPFAYWMMCLGMKIFGINDFGPRIGGILASIISIIYVYRIAGLWLKENKDQFLVALIFASSGLFLLEAHVIATDIYLCTFILMAQFYIFNAKNKARPFLLGILLALGFLTKGPIILLFTVFPFIITALFKKEYFKYFKLKEYFIIIFLSLSLGLSWYVYVCLKHQGLLEYFLGIQVYDRVFTDHFGRTEAWYYFIFCFILSFFPYSIAFFNAIKNIKKNYFPKELLFFIIFPAIIFQLSMSKLSSYILPFYGLASLIAFYGIPDNLKKYIKYFAYLIILGFTFILLIFSIFGEYYINHDRFHKIKCLGKFKFFTSIINKIDPEKKEDLLIYSWNLPSMSFYRDKLAYTANYEKREILFEKSNSLGLKHYLDTDEKLNNFIKEREKFFLVCHNYRIEDTKDNKCELELMEQYSINCKHLSGKLKHNYQLYECFQYKLL